MLLLGLVLGVIPSNREGASIPAAIACSTASADFSASDAAAATAAMLVLLLVLGLPELRCCAMLLLPSPDRHASTFSGSF
jgi:hypothetical protein